MRTREEQARDLASDFFDDGSSEEDARKMAMEHILEAECRAEQRVRTEIAQDRYRLNWLEAEVAATGIVSLSAVMREDGNTIFYCPEHQTGGSSTSLRDVIDIARGLAEAEDQAFDRMISNHDP